MVWIIGNVRLFIVRDAAQHCLNARMQLRISTTAPRYEVLAGAGIGIQRIAKNLQSFTFVFRHGVRACGATLSAAIYAAIGQLK